MRRFPRSEGFPLKCFTALARAVSHSKKVPDFNLDFLKNAHVINNVPGLRCLACCPNRDFPLTGSESWPAKTHAARRKEFLTFRSFDNLKRDIARKLAARNEHLNGASGGAFRHFGGDLGVRYEGEGRRNTIEGDAT